MAQSIDHNICAVKITKTFRSCGCVLSFSYIFFSSLRLLIYSYKEGICLIHPYLTHIFLFSTILVIDL